MMSPTKIIRVRDLATNIHFNLPESEPALRVSYDVFHLDGPAQLEGGMLHYEKDGQSLEGRAKEAPLGDCAPGERVLLRDRALFKEATGWWLCEVEAVNGQDIA